MILAARGRNDQAALEATAVLAIQREVLGDAHGSTLTTMQTLGNALIAQGKLDEAEEITREALGGLEQLLGEDHAQTLSSMNSLAYLLEQRKQVDAAEAMYLLVDSRRAVGEDHAMTLIFSSNYGLCLDKSGQPEQARRMLESAHGKLVALMGGDHIRTKAAAQRLADVYKHLGLTDLEAQMRPPAAS